MGLDWFWGRDSIKYGYRILEAEDPGKGEPGLLNLHIPGTTDTCPDPSVVVTVETITGSIRRSALM